MKRSLIPALIVTLALTAAPLSAHDFWLAATAHGGSPGSTTVTITGNVGETFPVADTNTTADRVDLWRVIGPTGEHPAAREFTQEGRSFATQTTVPMPGTFLGIMTIKAREIEMTGKEFTEYLHEEGLSTVVAERARDGKSDTPARERYARYAKVVLGGDAGSAPHLHQPVGLKAEFVPLRNPAALRVGDPLSVQLLVNGRPVVGAQVSALAHDARVDVRTDPEGVATFTVTNPGAWLIRTVHMAPAEDVGTARVDWESYWVTLAFEVPGPSR